MKKKLLFVVLLFASTMGINRASAQDFALKTNFLFWATTTPNLSAEVALGKKITLDVNGQWNPFQFSEEKKIKHWLVQPELRFWTCEKFNRGFWGIHLLTGVFNFGGINMPFNLMPELKDHRFEGEMYGVGVSYGYQWYLGPHWNLEATIGAGYVYYNYDKFDCGVCGDKLDSGHKNYFGPTKLGLSLVYLFKSRK
jgi:hypothetical protein